jgi:radical SAM superfamily enzyme YgiQ (UPF0313 family)
MKTAGCRLVTVGFESCCQNVLDSMHKGQTAQGYYRFAEDAKSAKILVHGCIMYGNSGDTRETILKDYEFARSVNCDSMQFYPLFVYPGTKAYEWAETKGYLVTKNFSKWLDDDGHHNCVTNLPNLSGVEIVKLCQDATRAYHLRLGYLWMKLIQAIREPYEGLRTYKAALVYIKYVLKSYFYNVVKRAERLKEA